MQSPFLADRFVGSEGGAPLRLDALLDNDLDVDQDDLNILLGCLSGADLAPNLNCDEP